MVTLVFATNIELNSCCFHIVTSMSYRVAPAPTRQKRPFWPTRAFGNNFNTLIYPSSVFTQQFVHLTNLFPLYDVKESIASITPVVLFKIVQLNQYSNQSIQRGVRDYFAYRQPTPILFMYQNQPIVSPSVKVDNMGYRYRYFYVVCFVYFKICVWYSMRLTVWLQYNLCSGTMTVNFFTFFLCSAAVYLLIPSIANNCNFLFLFRCWFN